MSTRSNQYLAFGYMVDYKLAQQVLEAKYGDEDTAFDAVELFTDNGYEEKILPHNGVNVIKDGMSGEYFFFGKIVEKAEIDFPLPTVAVGTVKRKDQLNILAQFYALFGKVPGEMNLNKPGWFVINHYH